MQQHYDTRAHVAGTLTAAILQTMADVTPQEAVKLFKEVLRELKMQDWHKIEK